MVEEIILHFTNAILRPLYGSKIDLANQLKLCIYNAQIQDPEVYTEKFSSGMCLVHAVKGMGQPQNRRRGQPREQPEGSDCFVTG